MWHLPKEVVRKNSHLFACNCSHFGECCSKNETCRPAQQVHDDTICLVPQVLLFLVISRSNGQLLNFDSEYPMNPCRFLCDHVKNTIRMHSNSSVKKNYETCYGFLFKTDFQSICTSASLVLHESGLAMFATHLSASALKQLSVAPRLRKKRSGLETSNCVWPTISKASTMVIRLANSVQTKQLSKVLQRQSWQSQQEEVVRRRPQRCQPSSSAMFIGSLY